MSPPLLELRNVTCTQDRSSLFANVNWTLNDGDIVVLRGKSGCGKTTLLKCIASLVLHDGLILYHGSAPNALGIPTFRTRVLYVPQRPSMLPGSPKDFLTTVASLEAHKARCHRDGISHSQWQDAAFQRAAEVSQQWGVDRRLWEREWSTLSGGEAQRLVLAIALGLDTAEVILLDEPTSALDPVSTLAVEKYMVDQVRAPNTVLRAVVWITHSEEQGSRVGTRFIRLSAGGCSEEMMSFV